MHDIIFVGRQRDDLTTAPFKSSRIETTEVTTVIGPRFLPHHHHPIRPRLLQANQDAGVVGIQSFLCHGIGFEYPGFHLGQSQAVDLQW